MKILVIEPYMSASHAHWTKILCRFLRHEVRLLSLPGRHWKWRMHQAPLHFALQLNQMHWEPDVIIASEMMDLALFKSLIDIDVPIILYFHENQLTYPISKKDTDAQHQRDNHYGFINFTSTVVADHVCFNSEFHRQSFLQQLHPFLSQFPEKLDARFLMDIRGKSSVVTPGIDIQELAEYQEVESLAGPIILWNHRWEYDKDPNMFYRALIHAQEQGREFSVVLLGGDKNQAPEVFSKLESRLGPKVLQFGFVQNRADYLSWLWKSDVVISTSKQDFFGLSVVEAIYCQCTPLLPDRLAFPDHLPLDIKALYLYNSESDLQEKLIRLLDEWQPQRKPDPRLQQHIAQYDGRLVAEEYDLILRKLLDSA